jgi:hypothetical protein
MMYRLTYLDYIFDDGIIEAETIDGVVEQLQAEQAKNGPPTRIISLEQFQPASQDDLNRITAVVDAYHQAHRPMIHCELYPILNKLIINRGDRLIGSVEAAGDDVEITLIPSKEPHKLSFNDFAIISDCWNEMQSQRKSS